MRAAIKPLALLLAVIILPCASLAAPADQADDPNTTPREGLALYPGFRDALLKRGWQPVPSEYAYKDGFPEVSCGNALCSADWRRPDGHVGSFTLWPEYDANDNLMLIIAPAYDE